MQQQQDLARASASITQQSAFLALPIAALLRFALIMQFLAARERQLQLCASSVVEIDPQRNERHAFALDGADKLARFALMEEQLSRAARLMVQAICLRDIRGYRR